MSSGCHAHFIVSGGGQYLGFWPNWKVSMMIMRPPQQGQVLVSSASGGILSTSAISGSFGWQSSKIV